MPTKPAGTLYRGREGMWSWVGHRITGVVIFFFLLVHVLDTSLVRVSPEAYTAVIGAYKNPLMALGERSCSTPLTACGLSPSTSGRRVPNTSARCSG